MADKAAAIRLELANLTNAQLRAVARTAHPFDPEVNFAALLKEEFDRRDVYAVNDVAQLRQLLAEAVDHFGLNHALVDVRDWLKAANHALAAPTLVTVLFHETNTGHSEDSDGYVEAVYATEALAEEAKLREIRRLVAEGEDVYWNPDTEEEGPADWTDDFRALTIAILTTHCPRRIQWT